MKSLATFLLLVFLAAALGAYLLLAPLAPPAPTAPDDATYVDIPPGTSSASIALRLQNAQVLRSRYAFLLLRVIKDGTLRAGEYRFDRPASAAEVYARIVRGDVYTRTLVIPEGFNIFDIASSVQAAGLGDCAGFLAAERSDVALISDLSPHATSLEGFLFPDTYRFSRHATAPQMLAAMVRRFRQATAPLNLRPQTVARTVLLASLIEKEVSQDSERALVAGVFTNRLAQGIPLATDPTVVYAALLENRYRGTIYASDLQNPSRYNTYRHAGLPPGPIANPGLAALKAALSPTQTNYLYFVADANGRSRFAATLQQHNANVQEYRQAARPAAPVVPRSPQNPVVKPRPAHH